MENIPDPMPRKSAAKPDAPPPVPTPLGVRLCEARTAKRWSMRTLAAAASVASPGLPEADPPVRHGALSMVESGQQPDLPATTAVRLARALGVTVEWLVTGESQ
jgi:transcriptional regulator with XRE-family HTH domain